MRRPSGDQTGESLRPRPVESGTTVPRARSASQTLDSDGETERDGRPGPIGRDTSGVVMCWRKFTAPSWAPEVEPRRDSLVRRRGVGREGILC